MGSGTTNLVINVASGATNNFANLTFATFTGGDEFDNGTDTITINGAGGNETITGTNFADTNIIGGAGADTLNGGIGNDILTGGVGQDTLTGGTGNDTFNITGGSGSDVFNFAAGNSVLTISGSGTSGIISGYDIITDFTPGATAGTSEKLGYTGTAVVANTTVNGTDSTLQLNTNSAVRSHNFASGIITFDDTNTFAAEVPLTSIADVAAVAQYLQGNDIGTTGSAVAFTATLSDGIHTYCTSKVRRTALPIVKMC